MKRTYSYSESSLLLSSSYIGSVSKCGCCDSYHISVGNITLRLQHRDILILVEMLIEALENKSIATNIDNEKIF
jgi:hypothetical protein